jgi:hypothetical protein
LKVSSTFTISPSTSVSFSRWILSLSAFDTGFSGVVASMRS